MYYPAASLYKSSSLTFNFGPDFEFPPPDIESYAPVSSLATAESGGEGDDDAEVDFGERNVAAGTGETGGMDVPDSRADA